MNADAPSTPTDRRVTVRGTPARLERMVFSGRPYVVTNPGLYQPGRYRAHLDVEAGLATIVTPINQTGITA